MSEVINPPDYYFTGINFNPAFYAEDAGGLTQSLANTLYLRKTVPDTATAQETFTSGIITPTINSTSTGFLNIVVPMATSGSGLNVAVAPRTISGQVHHYSDGDNCVAGAGVHLNNGINNNSATNIHNGTGANPTGVVNIMTGTSSTGTVNIGTTGTTTNINGNSAIGVVGSGTVTINRPLTIGYSIQPTSGQIGHTTYLTINSTGATTNYYLFSATIPALNATFMCNWNFQYVLTSNATLNQPQLYLPSDPSLSNGTINLGPIPLIGQPTYYACHGSRTFFSPSSTSSLGIQMMWLPQISASSYSGYGSCTLTRIA
jgi:hypothetical protein